MAEDENVISLDERRRGADSRKGERRPPREQDADPSPRAGQTPDASAPVDDRPAPGKLTWLYCPTCRTLEYTELELGGGRVHNVCGTVVHEAPVELDLRAEATLAQVNLERLEILQSLLDSQRQRYEEYRHRLNLAAGRPLAPYAADDDRVQEIAAGVDAFGLLVSPFFQDPVRRFPGLAEEQGEGGAGEADDTHARADPPASDE